MDENEMRMIEARQACKRVPCTRCSGTGKIVVSTAPLRGSGLPLLITEQSVSPQGLGLYGQRDLLPKPLDGKTYNLSATPSIGLLQVIKNLFGCIWG